MANEATEERGLPERLRAPNTSGQRGGKGRRGTPTQQRAPKARSEGAEGDPQEAQEGNPPQGGPIEPEGAPQRAQGVRGPNAGGTETSPPRTAARA